MNLQVLKSFRSHFTTEFHLLLQACPHPVPAFLASFAGGPAGCWRLQGRGPGLPLQVDPPQLHWKRLTHPASAAA